MTIPSSIIASTKLIDPTSETEMSQLFGLPLKMVHSRRTRQHELWVWADATGDGYISKRVRKARGDICTAWKLLGPRHKARQYLRQRGLIRAGS